MFRARQFSSLFTRNPSFKQRITPIFHDFNATTNTFLETQVANISFTNRLIRAKRKRVLRRLKAKRAIEKENNEFIEARRRYLASKGKLKPPEKHDLDPIQKNLIRNMLSTINLNAPVPLDIPHTGRTDVPSKRKWRKMFEKFKGYDPETKTYLDPEIMKIEEANESKERFKTIVHTSAGDLVLTTELDQLKGIGKKKKKKLEAIAKTLFKKQE